MENFSIHFYMASPIAFGYRKPFAPMMLDGLLTWMLKGNAIKDDDLPDVELPLKQSGKKFPFYHASSWELVKPKFGTYCFVKTSPDDWAKRNLNIKQMLEMINYITTPEVIFYARGSYKDVYSILAGTKGCVSLGSKRVAGWGKVNRIKTSLLPDDFSIWDKQGRPARPIPVEEIPEEKVKGGIVSMPYKPPYWNGEKVPCLIPSLERWWPGITEDSIAESK